MFTYQKLKTYIKLMKNAHKVRKVSEEKLT